MKAIGIMNGTSLDGVDFVLVDLDLNTLKCQFLGMKSFKFEKKMRTQLKLATQHQLKVDQLALLHHQLGRFYSTCYKKLSPEFKKAECIGLHGQTVFHKGSIATLQIGEASYLAAESCKTVVADFRVADLALGGQGAPIATFFHQLVLAHENENLSVHNLGGISNLTLIKNKKIILGYDTGPANMLLDLCIQKSSGDRIAFDRDGKKASKGLVQVDLVYQMLKHPFFKKKAPKSCGREEFGEIFYQKFAKDLGRLNLNDRLATITEFVAVSITQEYQKLNFENSRILFCGGGSKNKFLLKRIQQNLPKAQILTTEDVGWPTQSIEAAAFAVLAIARICGIQSNIPKSTGAKRLTSLGKIVQV